MHFFNGQFRLLRLSLYVIVGLLHLSCIVSRVENTAQTKTEFFRVSLLVLPGYNVKIVSIVSGLNVNLQAIERNLTDNWPGQIVLIVNINSEEQLKALQARANEISSGIVICEIQPEHN